MKYKLLYFIPFIIGILSLSGCNNKTNNKQLNTLNSTQKHISIKTTNNLPNKNFNYTIINKELTIIKKEKPNVYNIYTSINKQITNLSKSLHISKEKTIKLLYNLGPYIIKYNKLYTQNPNKAKEYKKFIVNNLKKIYNINLDENLSEKILRSKETLDTIVGLFKIQNYLLPDGTLTTPEFKQQLIQFAKENNYKDLNQALEDYTILINNENNLINLNCDKISEPIKKAECEYYKKMYKK